MGYQIKLKKKRIMSPRHEQKLTQGLLAYHGLEDYIQCTQCNKRFNIEEPFQTHMLFKHGRFISSIEKARDMMLCTFRRVREQ